MKKVFITIMILLSILQAKSSYKIATIPEASGISYCSNSDTLIVANDEGWYYEITTDGDIVTKRRIGDYDLEGVVCEEDRFVFAIEDRGVLIVDRKTQKVKVLDIDSDYRGKKLKLFDKKSGIEGIAKVDDLYYLSKQAKKKNDSFIVVVKLDRYHNKIVDMIKHKIPDTAGLDYYNGSLYMVSDKKDLLVRYDLKQKKIMCKMKLPKSAQEGIAFDEKHLYIADDDGQVLKYKTKDIGGECFK